VFHVCQPYLERTDVARISTANSTLNESLLPLLWSTLTVTIYQDNVTEFIKLIKERIRFHIRQVLLLQPDSVVYHYRLSEARLPGFLKERAESPDMLPTVIKALSECPKLRWVVIERWNPLITRWDFSGSFEQARKLMIHASLLERSVRKGRLLVDYFESYPTIENCVRFTAYKCGITSFYLLNSLVNALRGTNSLQVEDVHFFEPSDANLAWPRLKQIFARGSFPTNTPSANGFVESHTLLLSLARNQPLQQLSVSTFFQSAERLHEFRQTILSSLAPPESGDLVSTFHDMFLESQVVLHSSPFPLGNV
jgi:hypothetical protein